MEEQIFAGAIHSRMVGSPVSGGLLNSDAGQLNLAALVLDDLVYLHWALGHVLPRPQSRALGTRRRLSPSESSDATKACIDLLRNPVDVVSNIHGWLRLFADRADVEGILPFGLFRTVLKRLVHMRGIPMISRLIGEELELLSSRQRYRPAIGPRASAQLPLFEEYL